MRVAVHPRARVESGAVRADGIVSIRGTVSGYDLVALDDALFGGRVLPLVFDDVGLPAWDGWTGPREEHVASALAFARGLREGGARELAVHCEQGKSRSAAVALAILSDSAGPGAEPEAVAALLAQDAECQMAPNPLVVRLADALLGRDGAIERALVAACPRFATWRAYWERKALDAARDGVDGVRR